MNLGKYSSYAPAVIRYGVGFVFLVFGVWQLIQPLSWLGYVPAGLPIDTTLAVYLNGVVDLVLGLLLVLGFFTRIAAAIGALHLLGITLSIVMGSTEIAVRDFALVIVLVGIFLHGPDVLCLESKN